MKYLKRAQFYNRMYKHTKCPRSFGVERVQQLINICLRYLNDTQTRIILYYLLAIEIFSNYMEIVITYKNIVHCSMLPLRTAGIAGKTITALLLKTK